jgi:hypothetical protein
MKFFFILITLLAVIMLAACERKTSEYQDQGTQAVNRNTSPPSEAAPPDVPPADSGAQLPPAAQSPETKPPQPAAAMKASFWNPKTGEIKDLPTYPGGARMNVQYGPINGVDSAFILLTTADPVEKIAAFYDKSVKSAGWTVAERMSDSELYKVKLKKGDLNEALVQVEKDIQTGNRRILLSRLEKPKPPANQPKQPKP